MGINLKFLISVNKFKDINFFNMLVSLLPKGKIWNPFIKDLPNDYEDTISSSVNPNPEYSDNIIASYPDYEDTITGSQDNNNSVFGSLLLVFSAEITRLHSRIFALMNEVIPGLSTELLEDWEKVAGLPNEFTPAGLTEDERRDLVHQKITQGKGNTELIDLTQNESFFIKYAENMGYTITITIAGEPFRVGLGRVGDRLGSSSIAFYWKVNGDYDDLLVSLFEDIKPAHTIIIWD